jgi:hypothetical protein
MRKLLSSYNIHDQTELSNQISTDGNVLNMVSDIELSSSISISNVNSVVLMGNGNYIDGGNTYQILTIISSSITISDWIFRNASTTQNGGALLIRQNSVVIVSGCTFYGNSAVREGGGGGFYKQYMKAYTYIFFFFFRYFKIELNCFCFIYARLPFKL